MSGEKMKTKIVNLKKESKNTSMIDFKTMKIIRKAPLLKNFINVTRMKREGKCYLILPFNPTNKLYK